MIGLSLSLLAVLIIFLTGIDQTGKPDTCRAVAILLQYFLLCTFFWMVVEAYNLYRRLIVVWDDHIHYFLPKSILFAHGKDKCSFIQAELLLDTNFFRYWCSRGNVAYIWERIFLLVLILSCRWSKRAIRASLFHVVIESSPVFIWNLIFSCLFPKIVHHFLKTSFVTFFFSFLL